MDCNLSMVRGDTMTFGVELEDENGALFTQDLESAYFTCKTSYDADDAVFQKDLTYGITKVATGQYVVRVAPQDTENIEAGQYYYDFEIGVNSDIFTVLKGVLTIENDVTNQEGKNGR